MTINLNLHPSKPSEPAPTCPVESCSGPELSHDGCAIGCGIDREPEECDA